MYYDKKEMENMQKLQTTGEITGVNIFPWERRFIWEYLVPSYGEVGKSIYPWENMRGEMPGKFLLCYAYSQVQSV